MNNKPQCSELFKGVFDSGVGGCVRTCGCGITHFDGYNTWDWEEEELEKLQQKAKDQPTEFVEHDCSIGTMEIDNIQIVYECTCNIARRYESFILSHSRRLAEYLNKHAAILQERASEIMVQEHESFWRQERQSEVRGMCLLRQIPADVPEVRRAMPEPEMQGRQAGSK